MSKLTQVLCVLVLMSTPMWASAEGKTRAQLILPVETAQPGTTVMAGIRLQMEPGWHTYWRNSGDSGEATSVKWTLPEGIEAGEMLWLAPEKYVLAGFTTYVYHNETVLLVPLKLAGSLASGPVELRAHVNWLECEQLCLPGETDVTARIEIGPNSVASSDAARIERFRERIPKVEHELKVDSRWAGPADGKDRPFVIEFEGESPDRWDFFPYSANTFEVSGDTEWPDVGAGKVVLRKTVSKFGEESSFPSTLRGVLIHQGMASGEEESFELTIDLSTTNSSAEALTQPNGPVNSSAPPQSLWANLLLGFIGGFILNFMPCVLPVIALKVLSFVSQGKETPARVRALGLVYGVGVLISFLVLAILAIGVIKAGGYASWGMVLHNQPFRVLMTILITLVALNLFGLFEITPGRHVMGAASGLAAKQGFAGALFNGALATVLATPCTAPFLAGAVGWAFRQPPLSIILVFLAAGAGLAFPFVVLCWQPAWLKWLPKPGAWMERFKVAMGFPMLATAVWLFWLTALRFGKTGVLWLGLFLVVLALAAWIWGEFVQRGSKHRGLALAISLAVLAAGYIVILERQLHWRIATAKSDQDQVVSHQPGGINWRAWSPEAVMAARSAGHPVLVDFTADTCVNCQFNKVTSLETDSTREKLREIGAVAFLGDFTDGDPRIARVLQEHDRAGVPLVLVYPEDTSKSPLVLPPLLTPGIVFKALNEVSGAEN